MNPVDKARVRAAFSRGAAAYDAHASVQAEVRAQVLALAAEAAPAARRVLDVGCGTGRLLEALQATRPAVRAAGVDLAPGMCRATREAAPRAAVAAGDAEALPFRAGAFDLLVSTSTFQWLPRLEPALAECARVLAPGGRLVLALFAERTLHELKGAWREAAGAAAPDRTHRFFTSGEVRLAVEAAGLTLHRVVEAERVVHHPDVPTLLRSLKAIGAQNAAPGATGLAGRRTTLEMLRRYQARHGGPAGVPATWHMVYAVASR